MTTSVNSFITTAKCFMTVRLFPPFSSPATKETAFVYSLTSASLAYAITRACSEGQIPQCGCDDSTIGVPIDDWVWGGCSDDVQFGINFARDFLDSRQQEGMENKTTKELGVALVSLHNNAVGRTVYHTHTLRYTHVRPHTHTCALIHMHSSGTIGCNQGKRFSGLNI